MLLLLDQSWPWLLIGGLLLFLGFSSLGLTLREWIAYLASLPFTVSQESTETEKKQLDQPIEEVAAANPGCMLLLAGLVFVGYGLFRQFT